MHDLKKILTFFFAIALLFLSHSTIFAQDTTSTNKANQEKIRHAARALIDSVGLCALITIDTTGKANVRTMDPFPPDKNFIIWLGTNRFSRKVQDIRHNSNVALYYNDPKGGGYVTIQGQAEIVDDPAQKSKRWKKEWEQFYQNREQTYILIKVYPEKLFIIDYRNGFTGDAMTWGANTYSFKN